MTIRPWGALLVLLVLPWSGPATAATTEVRLEVDAHAHQRVAAAPECWSGEHWVKYWWYVHNEGAQRATVDIVVTADLPGPSWRATEGEWTHSLAAEYGMIGYSQSYCVGEEMGVGVITIRATVQETGEQHVYRIVLDGAFDLCPKVEVEPFYVGEVTRAVHVTVTATRFEGQWACQGEAVPGVAVMVTEKNQWGSQPNRKSAETGTDGQVTVTFTMDDWGSTWKGQHPLLVQGVVEGMTRERHSRYFI